MQRTKEGRRRKGGVILSVYLQEAIRLTFNTDVALSVVRSLLL